jgi:hypothetical protein
VAHTAELARDAEVQADRLGVTQVQVAVRLGRKTRDDLAAVLAGGRVTTLPPCLPAARSSTTIWRMKLLATGVASVMAGTGRANARFYLTRRVKARSSLRFNVDKVA